MAGILDVSACLCQVLCRTNLHPKEPGQTDLSKKVAIASTTAASWGEENLLSRPGVRTAGMQPAEPFTADMNKEQHRRKNESTDRLPCSSAALE